MTKLLWVAAAMGLGSAGSVLATEPNEPISFHAVNPVLQSLVDAVTTGDELVDFAYPKFDESYSDLANEKLKYDLQGSLKNTPWLDGGRADVTGTSTYFTERSDLRMGIGTVMAGTIRTDVMALIRYSAYIAKRKTKGIPPKFEARYNAHLERLAVATSLREVKDLLVSGQRLAKDMATAELQKEVEYLHCIENGACQIGGGATVEEMIAQQKIYVADWEATLPSYDLVTITARTEADQVRELIVSHPNAGEFTPAYTRTKGKFVIIPAKLKISFTDNVVSSSIEAFHQMSEKKLNRYKSDLEKNLRGVQNGNAQQKDEAQLGFRRALIEFKKTIRGEF